MFGMIIPDDGTELKNIAQQLQNFGAQIQNLGMQISNINQNFGIQMQNIGLNISNMAMQIFTIGTKISNINRIQEPNIFHNQNLCQMPMMNIINNNQLGMNNNCLNKIFDESKATKITVFFKNPSGDSIPLIISEDETIGQLINIYAKRMGINFNEFFFLYNGKIMNQSDKTKIKDFDLHNYCWITVLKKGGP